MMENLDHAYRGAYLERMPTGKRTAYGPERNEKLRIAVTDIIHELGVPANIKGYFYLREAILFKMNAPDTVVSLTKTLYPTVGDMFDTSAGQVERAIRHAIAVAWRRETNSPEQDYFGYSIMNFKKKPKNSELIATIVDRLKLMHY